MTRLSRPWTRGTTTAPPARKSTISIWRTAGLCLDCSPVRRIALQCKGIGSAAGRCAEEDCLTHFEWEIPADAAERFGFLRFVLTDSQGRRAFTNPYYPA